MTDEELAVYLDRLVSNETDIESLKSLDVDSLEVLSVSRSAMIKYGNGSNIHTDTTHKGVTSHKKDGHFGGIPEDLFIAASINNCCMMDTPLNNSLPFSSLADQMYDYDDDNIDDLLDDIDGIDKPF